jgi:hypothetical protein
MGYRFEGHSRTLAHHGVLFLGSHRYRAAHLLTEAHPPIAGGCHGATQEKGGMTDERRGSRTREYGVVTSIQRLADPAGADRTRGRSPRPCC